MLKNSQKQSLNIHIKKEDIAILDDYVNRQNITSRKRFIEHLVNNFIKTLK